MADDVTPEMVAAKLNEWFPWATWEASAQGPFVCVWVTGSEEHGAIGEFAVVGSATERVARCRTWRAAMIAAKRWAWSVDAYPYKAAAALTKKEDDRG